MVETLRNSRMEFVCVGYIKKRECRLQEYKNPVRTSQETLLLRYIAHPVNAVSD
jgi:hypothetical protein